MNPGIILLTIYNHNIINHTAVNESFNLFLNTFLIRLFQITNLMHNSFILQQYVCYTTLLNMFGAARCSSSGGPIVSPQPLVSSPSVNSRTICRCRGDCSPLSTCILYGCLQRVTIPEAVVIQLVLLRMSSVLLETCWGYICCKIKELCIKLVIWKSLYYDARSEKHQTFLIIFNHAFLCNM